MANRQKPTLRQLARDVVDGKVFGSWMVHRGDEKLLGMIFMPVLFGGEDTFKDAAHMYEYYDEAGLQGINGYPIFFSCFTLTKDEAPKFDKLLRGAFARAQLAANLRRILDASEGHTIGVKALAWLAFVWTLASWPMKRVMASAVEAWSDWRLRRRLRRAVKAWTEHDNKQEADNE